MPIFSAIMSDESLAACVSLRSSIPSVRYAEVVVGHSTSGKTDYVRNIVREEHESEYLRQLIVTHFRICTIVET